MREDAATVGKEQSGVVDNVVEKSRWIWCDGGWEISRAAREGKDAPAASRIWEARIEL
jgi:hypothetical protein